LHLAKKCEICGDEGEHQTFTICVDGVPLRLGPVLCGNHGGNFLIRVGSVLATLHRPIGEVLVGWQTPGPIVDRVTAALSPKKN